jgi:hypothetical protein
VALEGRANALIYQKVDPLYDELRKDARPGAAPWRCGQAK